MNPLVSIVIPAYNTEKYILTAITSAFNQDYSPLEVIVVDDGSTDKTNQISSTTNARIISLDENQGAGNALRIGFEEARGDYICWLSADDMFVNSNKTSVQLQHMQNTHADWSYFGSYHTGQSMRSSELIQADYIKYCKWLTSIIENDNKLQFLTLLYKNPVNGSTVMIKKETLEKYGTFDSYLKLADADCDLWMRYAILGAKATRINESSIFYRLHPQQLSNDTHTMFYGTEVTRCRAILSLMNKENYFNDMLQSKKMWLYYLLMSLKYLDRPLTTKTLIEYINANLKEPNFIFSTLKNKMSPVLDEHIRLWTIKSEFEDELFNALDSDEYKKHLKRMDNL